MVLKAVILAAGKGTRLLPLTTNLPKPLLSLHGIPILEFILDGIVRAGIRDIGIVIGFRSESIVEWIHTSYLAAIEMHPWRAHTIISSLPQADLNGTGGALLAARTWVGNSPMLVTYGDILLSWSVYHDVVAQHYLNPMEWIVVGNFTNDPSSGAAIYPNPQNPHRIIQMIEKPPRTAPPTDLNNAGLYVFPPAIFHHLVNAPLSPRGELELTTPIISRIEKGISPYLISVRDAFWCDVGSPAIYAELQSSSTWISRIQDRSNKESE